jgi:hypothetical protein
VAESGTFSRLFVLVNRLFGAGAVIAGVSALVTAAERLIHGEGRASGLYAIFGIVCVVVGVVYLRAPLSRCERRERPAD